jgi:hypothetical protein
MTAILDPNTNQNYSAVLGLAKIEKCENEPQKLLIPKELPSKNEPERPKKTPEITQETTRKTQKAIPRPPRMAPPRRMETLVNFLHHKWA